MNLFFFRFHTLHDYPTRRNRVKASQLPGEINLITRLNIPGRVNAGNATGKSYKTRPNFTMNPPEPAYAWICVS